MKRFPLSVAYILWNRPNFYWNIYKLKQWKLKDIGFIHVLFKKGANDSYKTLIFMSSGKLLLMLNFLLFRPRIFDSFHFISFTCHQFYDKLTLDLECCTQGNMHKKNVTIITIPKIPKKLSFGRPWNMKTNYMASVIRGRPPKNWLFLPCVRCCYTLLPQQSNDISFRTLSLNALSAMQQTMVGSRIYLPNMFGRKTFSW